MPLAKVFGPAFDIAGAIMERITAAIFYTTQEAQQHNIIIIVII